VSWSFGASAEPLQAEVVDEAVRLQELYALFNISIVDLTVYLSNHEFETVAIQVAEFKTLFG
jgi:hypothetical protein